MATKIFANIKLKLHICIGSGFGMQSEDKQKQVEALTLVKSMKLEAHPIALRGWVVHWQVVRAENTHKPIRAREENSFPLAVRTLLFYMERDHKNNPHVSGGI